MATGNTTSYSFEIEKMFNRADKKQAYYFQPALLNIFQHFKQDIASCRLWQ